MTTFQVELPVRPHEMAREEIAKQVAFLSTKISNARFSSDPRVLEFEAPEGLGGRLCAQVADLASRIEASLRELERHSLFRSSAAGNPVFAENVCWDGVHLLGPGQVALSGLPLRLFHYFDRVFEQFGAAWSADPVYTPALIPAEVLAGCDYFRSFPQSVTFASHLRMDREVIAAFRARHEGAVTLEPDALSDMETPEACLSPAVCYHAYHLNQGRTLSAPALCYGMCGKCFRYECTNMADLRRLWDFTMREIVFIGARDTVRRMRQQSIAIMSEFLEHHRLAAEIRTASDPFFAAPDAVSRASFQLSSDSKFEVSLFLPEGRRMAAGSHNYHADFFGRAFHIDMSGGGTAHTACVAFGLERWVYGFLVQHGSDITRWPATVRRAPEFRSLTRQSNVTH